MCFRSISISVEIKPLFCFYEAITGFWTIPNRKTMIPLFIMFFFIPLSYQNALNVYGPGLQPQKIIMPARYFFVNFTAFDEKS